MTGAGGEKDPELRRLVVEMRDLQRAWFGGDKRPQTLQRARAAERAVDAYLEGGQARLELGDGT